MPVTKQSGLSRYTDALIDDLFSATRNAERATSKVCVLETSTGRDCSKRVFYCAERATSKVCVLDTSTGRDCSKRICAQLEHASCKRDYHLLKKTGSLTLSVCKLSARPFGSSGRTTAGQQSRRHFKALINRHGNPGVIGIWKEVRIPCLSIWIPFLNILQISAVLIRRSTLSTFTQVTQVFVNVESRYGFVFYVAVWL